MRPILNSSPIQHILFPPHHQDPPDAIPKCKGFALVTLTEPTLVSHLVTLFPYDTAHVPTDSTSPEEETEARKAGFRALSKDRWDKLQAEYAEYRDSLLRRIAAAEATPTTDKIKSSQYGSERTPGPGPGPTSAAQSQPQPPQSYPAGCVLFARHVPADTNKTALRTRFSALLADAAALDYVDYTKGLDSVRVSDRSLFTRLTLLAVLLAPDDSRGRAGIVRGLAEHGIGPGVGTVGGTTRGGILGERARKSACAGSATCACAEGYP